MNSPQLFLQTLALPAFEDLSKPEFVPAEAKVNGFNDALEVVENFRRDINYWFVRYQNFYDRTNAAMRDYRLSHVDLVTRIFNDMMTVFGDNIETIRQSAYSLLDVITERQAVLGETNECLQGVIAGLGANSVQAGSVIQQCALYANGTFSRLLTNNFYPAFAGIQQSVSAVPNGVIDALSRGNVLQDEQEIIEFLRMGYEIYDRQWTTAVSQLLRWETSRFEVDGLFLVDEMRLCLAGAVVSYITTNAGLESDAIACT